jgi:hypothetical protein
MIDRRLFAIRNRYDASASGEKLTLLKQLEGKRFTKAADIRRLHSALCFIRAFPESRTHHRLAHRELARMEQRVDRLASSEQTKLADTGIVGTKSPPGSKGVLVDRCRSTGESTIHPASTRS